MRLRSNAASRTSSPGAPMTRALSVPRTTICTIASIVLRADVGEACAKLRGWPGARINQDNVIWKPPGTKPLGFHQDDSYQTWIDPPEMITCCPSIAWTRSIGATTNGAIRATQGKHSAGIS